MSKLHTVALITQDYKMLELISRINIVIDSSSSILLIGETGTSKEVFADYNH